MPAKADLPIPGGSQLDVFGGKVCTECEEYHPLHHYYYRPDREAYVTKCEPCRKAYRKQYYRENREQVKKTVEETQDLEKKREREKEYRSQHHVRQKRLLQKKGHYRENREYYIEQYYANREERVRKATEWKRNNPEKVKKHKRRYYRKNREKILARQAKRRAERAEAPGSFDRSDVHEMFKEQEGRCYYCDELLDDEYHCDHYIPLAKGGTNYPDNIVLSCPECNFRKGDMMPEEFIPTLED